MTARVMVVEDDPTLLIVMGDYLRKAGYDVIAIDDGSAALAALGRDVPDLLVLDRMLPGASGDDVCRAARATSPDVPIIMVTALGDVEHRVSGLERGADDYLAKPFSLRELHLRIEGLLRRSEGARRAGPALFATGPFRVDAARRRIWKSDREITLTAREYELFLYLLENPDRVVSRDEILKEVWAWSFGEASTVTVHVRRLREKIEDDPSFPEHLVTVWGSGYRLEVGRVRDAHVR